MLFQTAMQMLEINMPQRVRDAMLSAYLIAMALLSIALIVLVLMQRTNENDIGVIGGAGGGKDTYLGKNKSRTYDWKMKLATLIVGVLLLVISILYFIFQ